MLNIRIIVILTGKGVDELYSFHISGEESRCIIQIEDRPIALFNKGGEYYATDYT